MSTYTQAKALSDDVAKAAGPVSWQIGQVINALIEEAKKEEPDNATLAALTPLRQLGGTNTTKGITYHDVRAIVGQIVSALAPPDRFADLDP